MKNISNIAERMRLDRIDAAIAALLAVAGGLFYAICSLPGLDPTVWEELSVAAGLVPPHGIFPGLWRLVARIVFGVSGVSGMMAVMKIGGILSCVLALPLVYVAMRRVLMVSVPVAAEYDVWRGFISRFFAAMSAVAVAASDPVWRMSQTLSPDLLLFVVFLALANLWLSFLVRGSLVRLYAIAALAGAFAAESPFALVLPAVFIFSYARLFSRVRNWMLAVPDSLPSPSLLPRWKLFFVFVGFFATGMTANLALFSKLNGMAANGWVQSEMYLRYLTGYGAVLFGASSWLGWILGFAFCILPFVLVSSLAPGILRDDRPIGFAKGLVLLCGFALSLAHSGAIPWLSFWANARTGAEISSGFLLGLLVLCEAIAIGLAGAVFTFECQGVYLEKDGLSAGRVRRAAVPCIVAVVFAVAAVRAFNPVDAEMLRAIYAAVDETMRECGDAKWLFTDGRLDDAVRLRSAATGSGPIPLNMMSRDREWDRYVRSAPFPKDGPDHEVVLMGVPQLLRMWYGEKPGGMEGVALQLGFEMWKRDNKPLPPVSGFVARADGGMTKAEIKRGVDEAGRIARRMIDLAPRIEEASPSRRLFDLYSSIAWRISRMARFRGEAKLADTIDESNAPVRRMMAAIERERHRLFMQLTPLETLQFALRRADFAEAMRAAPTVLRVDADNPDANFGMGMGFLMEGNLEEAERYLKRVLVRRPEEPAVFNNLSIICRKLKRYEEAEALARKAIALLPDSPEVQETLQEAIDRAP